MKRDYSADYIRVIAMLMVVSFHIAGTWALNDTPLYGYRSGEWGPTGTALFFILSGYLLRMTTPIVTSIKNFFTKKVIKILVPFWIAFATVWIVLSVLGFKHPAWWRLVYSLFGVDRYAQFYGVETWAMVGEWFTAVILALYILYPLVSFLYNKSRLLTVCAISTLQILNVCLGVHTVSADVSIITGLFLLIIGMLIYDFKEEIVSRKWIAIPSAVIMALLIFTKGTKFSAVNNGAFAVACMLLLIILFARCDKLGKVNKVVTFISNISYCEYIIHHVLVDRLSIHVAGMIDNHAKLLIWIILLYLVTLFAAAILYFVSSKIIDLLLFHKNEKVLDEKAKK